MGVAEDLAGKILKGLRQLQVNGFTQLDGGLRVNGLTEFDGPARILTYPIAVQPQSVFPDLSAISRAISSLSMVHLGLGGSITLTPQVTGRVNIRFAWNISDGTSGMTTITMLRWGTGAAPAFGAAPAGTAAPISRVIGFTIGTFTYVGSIEWEVTGLVLGTTYWFDLTGDVNGGVGTWNMITAKVQEF